MDSLISLPPGFGFHPTDVELISHYLKKKILGQKIDFEVIPEVDIYKYEPWDLPAMCNIPTRDSKWHFFTSRDRKYPKGLRSNRATEAGYWKSTGKDRNIKVHKRIIGTKKTLVFHEGRPPSGKRTDWIMHEYDIDENECKIAPGLKDLFVLCRVTKRNDWALEDENNCPEQTNVMTGSVTCDELSGPSGSAHIQEMVSELLDPDFCGISPADEQKSEICLDYVAPKVEPVDSCLDQSYVDDTEFLLPEDIYSILYPGTDNFNEVIGDPTIGTTDAALLHSSSKSDNLFPLLSLMEDEIEKKEIPPPYDDTNAFTNSNENIDTGIQVRQRCQKPIEVSNRRVRLQIQLHKMETRNSGAINETIKLVDQHGHLNLNDGSHCSVKAPIVMKIRSVHKLPSSDSNLIKHNGDSIISNDSEDNQYDLLHPTESSASVYKSEASIQKSSAGSTGPRRSRASLDDMRSIQGVTKGPSLLLRKFSSAGLNYLLLLSACMVGAAGLILYFSAA